MFIRSLTPLARRSALSAQRCLSTTPAMRYAADPYPLPLSDPALASSASRSGGTDKPKEGEEWPLPEPLDRSHEDESALRARLVYQTRKRGTLETDLLLSTFARDQLATMSVDELKQFDKLLDEPDWDIFYWAVQKREPPPKWRDTELLAKLIKHARNEGKVVRMMPELMQRAPEQQ